MPGCASVVQRTLTRCQNGPSLGNDLCCAINRFVIDYFKLSIKEISIFSFDINTYKNRLFYIV